MKIELNEETRFSIGDTIYFLDSGYNGIELTHDVVKKVEIVFYKNRQGLQHNIRYITRRIKWVDDFSAFASEEEYETKSS